MLFFYIKFQNHKKISLETENYLNIPFMVLKMILLPVIPIILGRKEIHKQECVWSEKTSEFLQPHTGTTHS